MANTQRASTGIAGTVSIDEAKEIYGFSKEPKPYIRIVPQPS
jgi:hypothetical protein